MRWDPPKLLDNKSWLPRARAGNFIVIERWKTCLRFNRRLGFLPYYALMTDRPLKREAWEGSRFGFGGQNWNIWITIMRWFKGGWLGFDRWPRIQQRQGNFDRKCTCGGACSTCDLLFVGSIDNCAPRRIHMTGNNNWGPSWLNQIHVAQFT